MKPALLQLTPLPDADQAPLEAAYETHAFYADAAPEALLGRVGPTIRAIVTTGGHGVRDDVLAACPALEIVSVYGVGVDQIDLEACRRRGVRVCHTPGVLTDDVADLALGLMLSLKRDMRRAETWVRSGAWARDGRFALTRSVTGRRAGVLGLGRIGHAVARRAAAFGMEIGYWSRAAKPDAAPWAAFESAEALAAWCDILFVTVAATPETQRIVSRSVIAALGPEGALINVSRAANIDEAALLTALETGALGGAGLDVFENEPALDPRFLTLETVVLQPHAGSATIETRAAMGRLTRENLDAHFSGREPPAAFL